MWQATGPPKIAATDRYDGYGKTTIAATGSVARLDLETARKRFNITLANKLTRCNAAIKQ